MTTPIKLNMHEVLMFMYLVGTVKHEQLGVLCDWLDCREYVKPADRKLHPFILYEIQKIHKEVNCARDLFNQWIKANEFEVTLPYSSQERLISWIHQV